MLERKKVMNRNIKDSAGMSSLKKIVCSRYFLFFLYAVTLIFGTLYYYGLQMAFNSDAEDLATIWRCYKALELGQPLELPKDFIYVTLTVISTAIGGMSFFSQRLFFTLLQLVVLLCTMWLSFRRSKRREICLFLLPIFILFMILLHPATQEDPYGLIVDYGTDFFYQYPYNYHSTVRTYTLLCLIIISLFLYATSAKKKLLSILALFVLILYTVYLRDTLFFVLFLVPLCIVLFMKVFHNQKTRKHAIFFICMMMGLILLSKVIPSSFKSGLWTTEQALTYGSIYGGTNWTTPDMIWTVVTNYVSKILGCFNILLPAAPLISLYTLINVFKFVLLSVGYVIAFAIVKGSVVGKQKWKSVDVVDEILAWSHITLSAAHLFTEYGHNVIYSQRYMQAVVSIITILLCRQIGSFLSMINWNFTGMCIKEKAAISFILFALCLCYMKPVWNYTPMNLCHKADMDAAIEYMKGTDLGYAIAPFDLAYVLSAESNGEVLVCASVEEALGLWEEDAKITYMVTRYDFEPGKYHQYMYYEPFASYEELCDKYSEPTNIIEYDTFSLCIWEEGIMLQEQ